MFSINQNSSGTQVIMNGKTYNLPPGKSVSIRNNQIYVDGRPWADGPDLANVRLEIHVKGDPISVDSDQSVNVAGSVVQYVKAGGSVNVGGGVGGSVDAKGSVNCNEVKGSVTAGGSVSCDDVGGDVKAGGSVSCDNVRGSVQKKGWF